MSLLKPLVWLILLQLHKLFFAHEEVGQKFVLDSIITFVDCKYILQHLDEKRPEGVENEAVEQVAFADRLILNKTDLVNAQELKVVKTRLASLNPCTQIETQQSRAPIDQILDIKAFDLAKTLEMDDEFLNIDAEHKHDKSISSVGICIDGQLKNAPFNQWLTTLLRTKGNDIYRSKGILAFLGEDRKFVFQGVHMLLDFAPVPGQNWKRGEKRTNRVCFIGKNLDRKELQDGLRACVYDGKLPDPGPIPDTVLRFKVGDRIQANCGEWTRGVVTKQWYREQMWETGHYAAYQIRLDDGGLIYAPRDTNKFVKPL
jgi:G3E family GTPase